MPSNPSTVPVRITSRLGDPRPYGEHEGLDLAPVGGGEYPPVVAIADGEVTDVGYMPEGYGYYIKIKHPDGLTSLYGHLAFHPEYNEGDQVRERDLIGYMGNTGYSTGTHLHLSIIDELGRYLNPLDYIDISLPSTVRMIGDAIESATERLQGASDCYERWFRHELADDELDDCLNQYLTPEERAALHDDEVARALATERDPVRIIGSVLTGIGETPGRLVGEAGDAIGSIPGQFGKEVIQPLADALLDIALIGPRLAINTFKLSDKPLKNGRETFDWLKESEHQTYLFVSVVALVLIIFLLIVAAVMFLAPDQKTMIQAAETAAKAAV